MTRRTPWQQAGQKCCTPRCCRWPRKMKWSCGFGIRSIRRRVERGLGPLANLLKSAQRHRRVARHELTTSRWEEWRNGAERTKASQECEEEMASRSSRRDRHCGAAVGEVVIRTPLV